MKMKMKIMYRTTGFRPWGALLRWSATRMEPCRFFLTENVNRKNVRFRTRYIETNNVGKKKLIWFIINRNHSHSHFSSLVTETATSSVVTDLIFSTWFSYVSWSYLRWRIYSSTRRWRVNPSSNDFCSNSLKSEINSSWDYF